jgi:hypothetical protein
VHYREFYDATIVECMKLPLSLSVAGPSARKHSPALAFAGGIVGVVTHDRDLAAIADRVVTLAGPVSPGGPGVHRSTDLQQDGDRQEDGTR